MGQQGLPCAPCPVSFQQACEMVMDILRERDQGGFGDRNEYGSRIGGGIDVSVGFPRRWRAVWGVRAPRVQWAAKLWGQNSADPLSASPSGASA